MRQTYPIYFVILLIIINSGVVHAQESIFDSLRYDIMKIEKTVAFGGYPSDNQYERLPMLCVKAFVKALQRKWENGEKTLVFQTPNKLYRDKKYKLYREKLYSEFDENDAYEKAVKEKYPFTIYPIYDNMDWDALLAENNLLIRYEVCFTNNRFFVYLFAAIKPVGSNKILKTALFYDFYLAFSFYGSPLEIKKKKRELERQVLEQKIELFDDEGFVLPTLNESYFQWKIKSVSGGEIEEMEYKPSGNNPWFFLNLNE